MASRSHTPVPAQDHGIIVPQPTDPAHLSRGYGQASKPGYASSNVDTADFAASPAEQHQHVSQQPDLDGEVSRNHDEATLVGATGPALSRSNTNSSQYHAMTPSRHGTLKKKSSVSRRSSLKRSGSRRSTRPGSVYGMGIGEGERYDGANEEMHSPFYSPVPTSGSPTEILANRFQAWRKVLKDLITYFREVQNSYDTRSKALLKLSNVVTNINVPPAFLTEGGMYEATHILRDFHKQLTLESNKARDIENDVIVQLSGLRSDLSQKIKEIKALSGDFKNSVDKEMEGTRRALMNYQEAISLVDTDPNALSGKGDPYVVRLGVERQLDRQIDEENYLHRAFLNLESSGRELESIIVGEIQKAYNALATILKREADESYDTAEKLRNGPISLPKDHEWNAFVERDQHFIDPRIPLRRVIDIDYPGKDHPGASEVRSGMLERKSKYLKSYTPGWYVLSPTHLHEFKSADHIYSQAPIMSLYLADQKLGSHSGPESSSHKFMLKGRQTGSMHRGHSWVFRAETHDTMLAWFSDIKNLTEKTGEERNAFVRRHARSVSGGSYKSASISSDGGMEEDEADEVPYSANASSVDHVPKQETVERPQPGGRFPSDIQVDRDLQAPLSPSSGESDDHDIIAAATSLPGSGMPAPGPQPSAQSTTHQFGGDTNQNPVFPYTHDTYVPILNEPGPSHYGSTSQDTPFVASHSNPNLPEPVVGFTPAPVHHDDSHTSQLQPGNAELNRVTKESNRPGSDYGEWMAPAAAGAAGVAGVEAYRHHSQRPEQSEQTDKNVQPTSGYTAGDSQYLSTNALSRNESSAGSGKAASVGSGSTDPTTIEPSEPASDFPIKSQSKSNPVTSGRPGVPHSSKSVQSASELHIPGEYPPTPALE